jgi:hypothetical protein
MWVETQAGTLVNLDRYDDVRIDPQNGVVASRATEVAEIGEIRTLYDGSVSGAKERILSKIKMAISQGKYLVSVNGE